MTRQTLNLNPEHDLRLRLLNTLLTQFVAGQSVVVRDARDGQLFETIVGRFDGGQFWFNDVDVWTDPSLGRYLHDRLAIDAKPDSLDKPGLSAAHRLAYSAEYVRRQSIATATRHGRIERRVRAALTQAGAQFNGLSESGDVYRVDYTVDGSRFTSVVRGEDTTVVSAGICLSGQDRDFDLNSLVGALRESAAS